MNDMFSYKELAVSLDKLQLVFVRKDKYHIKYFDEESHHINDEFGRELLKYLEAKQNE